jgi:N-acetylmuramoyl-L-alanine amidase
VERVPYSLIAIALALAGMLPGPVGDARGAAAAAAPLAGRTVVIDPGHQLGNAHHPGRIDRSVWVGNGRKQCNTTGTATDAGFPEATFAWRVAQRMEHRLETLGARVIMTRDANSERAWGPCVDDRGRRGNRAHADLKISIHGDGSYARGAHGFHVIYAPHQGITADTYRRSHALALDTRAALQRAGFARATYTAGGDGLDVRADLGTLNLSQMATVMVECGNMRDPGDAARMTSSRGERRYADALVHAARHYLAQHGRMRTAR